MSRKLYRMSAKSILYGGDNVLTWEEWVGKGSCRYEDFGGATIFQQPHIYKIVRMDAYTQDTSSLTLTKDIETLSEMRVYCRVVNPLVRLYMQLDDKPIFNITKAPSEWLITPPIRLDSGRRKVNIDVMCDTSYGTAYIGTATINPYELVKCKFAGSTPFTQDTNVSTKSILDSYSTFYQTTKGYAQSEFSLYFDEEKEYLDFISNYNMPYVVRDELGVYYRGKIEITGSDYIARGIYYVRCTFKSSQVAGVSW